ncbi:MAG: hypothetical protein ACKO3K_20320 [Cuspidothrix sp.]
MGNSLQISIVLWDLHSPKGRNFDRQDPNFFLARYPITLVFDYGIDGDRYSTSYHKILGISHRILDLRFFRVLQL